MNVLDQADAGRNDVDGDRDGAGDGDVLVAGLGVVAFMGDRADDVNAARAGQAGGTAIGQNRAEVVRNTVVLDHGAVAVSSAVQPWTIAVRRNGVAEQASENDAVGHLPDGGAQKLLFVHGGWVPFLISACAQGHPRQPGRQDAAATDLHPRRDVLHLGNSSKADQVF